MENQMTEETYPTEAQRAKLTVYQVLSKVPNAKKLGRVRANRAGKRKAQRALRAKERRAS